MFYCEIKRVRSANGSEKIKVKKTHNGNILSEFIINIGDELVVKPHNKLKLKHRDRRVQIVKFTEDARLGFRAREKFLDNKRFGFVDINDLEKLI
jgi:hypothetical protein